MIGGINGSMMNMQAMQQRGEQMYSKIDSDGDGSINKTELEAFSAKVSEMTGKTLNTEDAFSSFDGDGDGSLSREEMSSFMAENHPTRPSMQSMQQRGGQMYSRIDSDGDGSINKAELEAFSGKIQERTGKTLNTEEALSSFDTDGDGALNREEMRSFIVDSGIRPTPPSMQQAMSAYGANMGSGQTPSILDLLDNQSDDKGHSSYRTEKGNDNMKTLMDILSNSSDSEDTNSLVDALT